MTSNIAISGGAGRSFTMRVPAAMRRQISAAAAAILIGFGFAGLFGPVIYAAAQLHWIPLALAQILLLLVAGCSVWLMIWTHARTLHVERLIARGLEVDQPSLSLAAQRRDLRGLAL